MADQSTQRRLAAILAADVTGYAKIHQYIVSGRLYKSRVQRKAFRDIEKAKEWLGYGRRL